MLQKDGMSKVKEAIKFLRRKVFRPYIKMLLMRLIVFYQRRLSHGTCMFTPTCSENMLRAINNHGVIAGVFLGMWRILRCNPFTKGGYDPVPENHFKVRWVL